MVNVRFCLHILRDFVLFCLFVCLFICLFVYGPFCHGALKPGMSTLFTTFFF